MILPFIELEALRTDVSKDYILQIERIVTTSSQKLTATNVPEITGQYSINWWWVLYTIGAGVSLLFFLLKLYKLKILRTFSINTNLKKTSIITLPNSKQAFSFWNSIYLGDALDEESKKQILIHELVHVKHNHSLDQLWFELLKILLWWNPLVYIYQSRITIVHEYMADAAVISAVGKQNYIEQLLNAVFQTQEIPFVNQFFNHSLIKKRILMLQKSKSKTIAKFKYLLLIPVVSAILVYTSCSTEPNSTTNNYEENVDENLKNMTKEELIEYAREKSKEAIKQQQSENKNEAPVFTNVETAEPTCLNKNSKYDMNLDNYLKLSVGANTEVIVDIVSTNTKKSIRTVHLGKNVIYYVRNIPEDNYHLNILYGTDYAEKTIDGKCTGYFKNKNLSETGDQILDFYTVKTNKGINVPSYNLSLDILPDDHTHHN